MTHTSQHCPRYCMAHVTSFQSLYTLSMVTGADLGLWKRGGLINIFTTGGGYGRGRAPSRDSKRAWGSADSSPSGVWGEAPAAFLLLRLFSMKFTVISNTFPSRDIRITRACMDSDDKTLHSSQCYGSYWLSN